MLKIATIIIGIGGFCLILLLSNFNFAYASDAQSYYLKGNSNITSGKMTEAIQAYNQAIEQQNSFFEAYLGLSIAYRETNDFEKALFSIRKAIELKPRYYQAYYNLGLILEKQGERTKAIKAYEKFLKEVPGAFKFSDANQRIFKLKKIK